MCAGENGGGGAGKAGEDVGTKVPFRFTLTWALRSN